MIEDKIYSDKISRIKHIVCELFDVDICDMTSKSRRREVCLPRQIAMSLCYYIINGYLYDDLTIGARYSGKKLSLKSVGLLFGDRDHSTVIHSIDTVSDLILSERRKYNNQGIIGAFESKVKSLWEKGLIEENGYVFDEKENTNHDINVEKSKSIQNGLTLNISASELMRKTVLTVSEI